MQARRFAINRFYILSNDQNSRNGFRKLQSQSILQIYIYYYKENLWACVQQY